MATTNSERQAAFKKRMRLAGKRQITCWVAPEQERALQRIFEDGGAAGDPGPDPALLTERKRLDALAADLARRETALHEAAARRRAGRTGVSFVPTATRVSQLVEAFTTTRTRQGESLKVGSAWRAEDLAKALQATARDTTLARNTLVKLLASYGERELLSDHERQLLQDTSRLLSSLADAADRAKKRVTSNAQSLQAAEDARAQSAADAVKAAFDMISVVDAVLLCAHLGIRHSYARQELMRMHPESATASDVRYYGDTLIRDVGREIANRVMAALSAGTEALAASQALRQSFDLARDGIAATLDGEIDNLKACLAAVGVPEAQLRNPTETN